MALSVSVTTRARRANEIDGRDYHFIDKPRFEAMIASDALLEWAEVFGNLYGTPRAPAEAALKSGPQVGQEVPGPFHPVNINGEQAGKKSCLYCANGPNPVAAVFARI